MKLFCRQWPILIGLVFALRGAAATYFETERGPHHKIWSRVSSWPGPAGQRLQITNTYVELATGLHYWKNNCWMPSQAAIEILQDAAVVRRSQHSAIFAANLNTVGALDLQTPEGKRLRSHVVGLAYLDRVSGRRVWIAAVQDCQGVVLAPHRVYYQDAFTGPCRADVRYTCSPAGLEQDVILRQAPPSPAAWGLDPATTCLEVFTEFLSSHQPSIRRVPSRPTEHHVRPLSRENQAGSDDVELDFGLMQIGVGQVFLSDEADPFVTPPLTTTKCWEEKDGRSFLIERVTYSGIESWLSTLPPADHSFLAEKGSPGRSWPARWAGQDPLPPPRGGRGTWATERWSGVSSTAPGLVIDYLISNSSLTNHTFRSGVTYLISGKLQLYGTTAVEGGTVVKYGRANSPQIEFNGPVECRTAPWHPAVFTSQDDDTVGEIVSGSTGRPEGPCALYALACRDRSLAYDWHDLRIRHARYGLAMYSDTQAVLSHTQIGPVDCAVAWQTGNRLRLQNFLIHDARHAFSGFSQALAGEQGTIQRVAQLRRFPLGAVALTNSLLVEVTHPDGFVGSPVAVVIAASGVFQSAGFGACYLAEGSPYRNAGTPFIDPILRLELQERTTDPPVVLAGHRSPALPLERQAQRDTDRPDLGYHYDPLDFLLRGLSCSNATLLVTNGATVGWDDGSTGFGLNLCSGASIISHGQAERRNCFVHWTAVQEGPGLPAPEAPLFSESAQGGMPAQASFRFTDFRSLGGRLLWRAGPASGNLGVWVLQDCSISGGRVIWTFGSAPSRVVWTNNAWDQVAVALWSESSAQLFLWNNLFFHGTVRIEGSYAEFLAKDNLFDQTDLDEALPLAGTHDHNGYVAGHPHWTPPGVHDVILPSPPVYAAGPLGRFYYPTNTSPLGRLLDRGSRSAATAGLCHFTTTTDQRKENASTVDIGFHYPAAESGQPADTDNDGWPDYAEDSNGNGFVDAGETDSTMPDTDRDGVADGLEWAQGGSPTRAGTIDDTTGTVRLRVHTLLE